MRKIFALPLALVLTLGVSTAALAAWNVGGTGSGAAQADQIPPITNVSANRSGETTTLSWSPITFSSGDPIGVTVSRTEMLLTGMTASVPNCEGAQAGCTDSTPEGRWVYTVGGRHHNWLGLTGVSGNIDVPPNTPTGAARSGSGDPVTITWTDNSGIEHGHRLERNVDGDGWVTAASVVANSMSVQDPSPLTCGVSTQYRVLASHISLGDSDPSNSVTVGGPPCASMAFRTQLTKTANASGSTWIGSVTVTVLDSDDQAIEGVTLAGDWMNSTNSGPVGQCVTDESGQCTFSRSFSNGSGNAATFTITEAALTGYTWDEAGSELSITVNRND